MATSDQSIGEVCIAVIIHTTSWICNPTSCALSWSNKQLLPCISLPLLIEICTQPHVVGDDTPFFRFPYHERQNTRGRNEAYHGSTAALCTAVSHGHRRCRKGSFCGINFLLPAHIFLELNKTVSPKHRFDLMSIFSLHLTILFFSLNSTLKRRFPHLFLSWHTFPSINFLRKLCYIFKRYQCLHF